MTNKFNVAKIFFLLILCIALTSCFGPRLNKHNLQSENDIAAALVAAHDEFIQVEFQFLLVKNSPKSWAKDAKWDEYIVNISNLNDAIVTIEKISIIDSLDYELVQMTSRRELIKATKKTKRRFKKAGIKLRLGKGSTHMLTKSIGGTVVGAGIGAGVASGGAVTMSAGTLTTAGGAVFVAVPAVLVGSIVKIVNNSKVNNKIQQRQTILPLDINSNSLEKFNIFYSAVPSPKFIKVYYSINSQMYELELALPEQFKGLHYK